MISTFGDDLEQHGPDPLGVVGWTIGGKYKVRSYIGGGGFGEVYEGFNSNLPQQRLVLKFFKEVAFRERFDREAQILCRLDHPNISRVMDYFPDENALVMQYIDGRNADQILHDKGPLESELLLKVARHVADAVAYAHKQGVAHRDLKPGNILIDKNGHVYLIDFGIAKEGTDASRTRTGYAALSVNFAAPERQGGRLDYNPYLSDVYELGITLFNLATNSFPYRNPAAPLVDEWKDSAGKKLAPGLRNVLKRATHPDPKKRYPSVDELAAALKEVDSVYLGGGYSKIGIAVAGVIVVAVAGYLLYPLVLGHKPTSAAQSPQGPGSSQQTVPPTETTATTVQKATPESAAPPSTPVLVSPSDGSRFRSAAPVEFAWRGDIGDQGTYSLEISSSSAFVDSKKYSGLRQGRLTISDLKSGATYYWRVVGMNADNQPGPYSETRSIVLESPDTAISASPVVEQGLLSLTVDQPSDIYINNQLRRDNGTTWQESLPVGTYAIRIQHGPDQRQWLNESLTVVKGRTTSRSFMVPAVAGGLLKITSGPSGAHVQITGPTSAEGKTPYSATVEPGTYQIAVTSLDGKQKQDSTVKVIGGKECVLIFVFQPPAAPPSNVAISSIDNEKVIKQTISRFQQALQNASVDQLKAVWPSISSKDRDAYNNSFATTGGMELSGKVSDIEISGAEATAQLAGTARPKTKGSRSSPVKFQFVLVRSGDNWLISKVTAIK